MQEILDIDTKLTAAFIWDADFLYGPRMTSGADTYVLCEINVSSTFTFPELDLSGVRDDDRCRGGTSARSRKGCWKGYGV